MAIEQITFLNMSPSPALEVRIKQKVAKLLERSPTMIRCDVFVEASSLHHHKGNPYSLHIHVTLPGGEMVVSHHPGKSPERDKDVYAAMNDAFKAIERQLKHFKDAQKREIKHHVSVIQMGKIAKLDYGDEYGLIEMADGTEIYFHKNAVHDNKFKELGLGTKVRYSFIEGEGINGPQANFVRIIK
jgi:ribosomal subunit interface protein